MVIGFNPNTAMQNYPQNYRNTTKLAFKQEVKKGELNPFVEKVITLFRDPGLNSEKMENIPCEANIVIKDKSLKPQDIKALTTVLDTAKKQEKKGTDVLSGYWIAFLQDVLERSGQKI